MKKQESEVRNKMVIVRMNASEWRALEDLHKKSTHKYLSTYARKVLLQKPVVLKYRNQSADDFLKEMIDLKKQLNGIGNNFNQAVHKLHMLEKIPEFRTWILNYVAMQQTLVNKVEEIKVRMNQIYQQMASPHRQIGT
jgi:hypothetical protein